MNLDLQMSLNSNSNPDTKNNFQTIDINHPKTTKNGSAVAMFSKHNAAAN